MYLNYLTENEKIAFLKIAHLVSLADDEICENEKVILGSYANEMGIPSISFELTNISLKSLSNEFTHLNSKKIVILELMSVIYANGIFKESEKEIIDELLQTFQLDDEFFNNVQQWSKALMNVIEQGCNLVLGNEK